MKNSKAVQIKYTTPAGKFFCDIVLDGDGMITMQVDKVLKERYGTITGWKIVKYY